MPWEEAGILLYSNALFMFCSNPRCFGQVVDGVISDNSTCNGLVDLRYMSKGLQKATDK